MNFDLPDHLTPEFPPPIFLTTAPQLGDASRGQLLSIRNFYEIMNGIITPVQMEGLRLLLTPFPQEEFEPDGGSQGRRPEPRRRCLDCHSNFHTNAAFHLTPDLRPQSARFRLDTVSLRAQTSFLDNNMHDLKLERFDEAGKTSNDLVMLPDGPIKTFTLRGIKDSPPYMHDGRLLTLGDTVEFFNLVLGLRLTQQEKDALPSVLHHLQAVQALLAELTGAASAGPCDEFVVARQREIGSDPLEGQKKSFRKALPAHASVHYVAKSSEVWRSAADIASHARMISSDRARRAPGTNTLASTTDCITGGVQNEMARRTATGPSSHCLVYSVFCQSGCPLTSS